MTLKKSHPTQPAPHTAREKDDNTDLIVNNKCNHEQL